MKKNVDASNAGMIFEPVPDQDTRLSRRRKNQELMEPDNVKEIKACRLRLVGLVQRLPDHRLVKVA